jgi:hypothetical protein
MLGEEYKTRNSTLSSFLHPPDTSSLFGPNILLSILSPNTLSLCYILNVRDQVSPPYRTCTLDGGEQCHASAALTPRPPNGPPVEAGSPTQPLVSLWVKIYIRIFPSNPNLLTTDPRPVRPASTSQRKCSGPLLGGGGEPSTAELCAIMDRYSPGTSRRPQRASSSPHSTPQGRAATRHTNSFCTHAFTMSRATVRQLYAKLNTGRVHLLLVMSVALAYSYSCYEYSNLQKWRLHCI